MSIEKEALRSEIVEALRMVFDPEIPLNIYDMGLIYGIEVGDEGQVDITMTLTSPTCPVAESLPAEVESRAAAVEGVERANVELVWDPPWTQDKLSEAAKLQLGLM